VSERQNERQFAPDRFHSGADLALNLALRLALILALIWRSNPITFNALGSAPVCASLRQIVQKIGLADVSPFLKGKQSAPPSRDGELGDGDIKAPRRAGLQPWRCRQCDWFH
jgi:hypothetical protein